MKHVCLKLLVLVAFVALAVSAQAVVVKPGDMGGWQTATNTGATATFVSKGPMGNPSGTGSFQAQTGWLGAAETPGQVWLGNHVFDGVYLRDITKLEYKTFTYPQGLGMDGTPPTYRAVSQPIQIQMAIRKAGPTGPDWRYLMYRPWGLKPSDDTTASNNPWGKWETHDAIACTSDQGSTGVWYDPWTNLTWTSFAAIYAQYPNAIISAPNYLSPESDNFLWYKAGGSMPNTGTGCGLNLEIGARQTITNIFGESGWAWWREGLRSNAFVDTFTITVSGVETTYDFEGPMSAGTYGVNTSSAKGGAMTAGATNNWFVIFGKVIEVDNPAGYIKVDDGSGTVVSVHIADHEPLSVGDYIRAKGDLDPTQTPAVLESASTDMTLLYSVLGG